MREASRIVVWVVAAAFAFQCFFVGSACAEEDLSKGERAILEKLEQLQKSVDELKERVKALEERLKAEEAPISYEGPILRRGPDLEKLKKVVLPRDPTKEQVREYLGEIRRISSGQTVFGSNDPQVRMIAGIGAENVDVLLEFIGTGEFLFYAMPALKVMVRPEHKELILEHLPMQPELVEVIVQQGWVEDAKDILIHGIHTRVDYLPVEWIDAVAQFKDPGTYDDLKWYLIHSYEPERVYEAIKDLPGMDLKETVQKGWQLKRYAPYGSFEMAKVAVRFGNVEALGELIATAADPTAQEWHSRQARRLVWRLTGEAGTGAHLTEWFKSNKDKLVFDPQAGVFSVKTEEHKDRAEDR